MAFPSQGYTLGDTDEEAAAARRTWAAVANAVARFEPVHMLVTADGIVKLTDFGIARAVGSAAMTKTGEVMGTAQYLAPEAAVGREVTGLADVYALGVIAYEMVAGRRPFEADSPVALALAHVNQPPPQMPQEVPPPVRAIILATLEKDPAMRPHSAAEFSRALRQAVTDSRQMGFDPTKRAPKSDGVPPAGVSGPHSPQPGGASGGASRPNSGRNSGPTSGPNSGPNSGPHSGPQGGVAAGLPGRHEVEHHPAPTGPAAPPSGHPAAANFQGDPNGPNAPTSGPHAATSGPHATSKFASTTPATRREQRVQTSGGQSSVGGNPDDDYLGLGISKKTFMYLVGGVVGLLVLVVIIVLLVNGNGSVTNPPGSSPSAAADTTTRGTLS